MKKVAVIGAGVIGLTSAIRLLEQGFSVTVFARDIQSNMASRAASALLVPIKVGPLDLITKWARRSREIYQTLPPESGVSLTEIVDFMYEHDPLPLWAEIHDTYDEIPAADIPSPYVKGLSGTVYNIDTSVFMDFLLEKVKALGGEILQQEFTTLMGVGATFPIIINCSGVWSHQLVPDDASFPIRGQFVITEKRPLQRCTLASIDDNTFVLIVARTHDCYIGGNTLNNVWDTKADAETTEAMLQQAKTLEPLLKNVTVKNSGTGLRPGRKEVRLKLDVLPDGRIVIHNYGHGGGGFTTAWGCADEVVALVSSF